MVKTLTAVGFIVVIILWGIVGKYSLHLKPKVEYNIKVDSYLNKIQEFGIKCYLQVLFTVGAFMSTRSWVDKHIKVCYNRLDEINSDYDKQTRTNWYPKK